MERFIVIFGRTTLDPSSPGDPMTYDEWVEEMQFEDGEKMFDATISILRGETVTKGQRSYALVSNPGKKS